VINHASQKPQAAKVNRLGPARLLRVEGQPLLKDVDRMDAETESLIQRWIIAFCETPVLVDAELMRVVLADVEDDEKEPLT
jgi:hypothetical protein